MPRLLWLLTFAYCIFLVTMTHLPPGKVPDMGANDKLEHLGAYGLLSGAFFISLWASFPRKQVATWLTPTIILAFGALDEITQPFFGRSCELNDWLADATGMVIAVTTLTLIRLMVNRKIPVASRS